MIYLLSILYLFVSLDYKNQHQIDLTHQIHIKDVFNLNFRETIPNKK